MYIGPKSRTERPRKTKIDTEVAHVTRDSDTTLNVKRLKVKVTGGGGILWQPPVQLVLPGLLHGVMYTVSKKPVPNLASCSFDKQTCFGNFLADSIRTI